MYIYVYVHIYVYTYTRIPPRAKEIPGSTVPASDTAIEQEHELANKNLVYLYLKKFKTRRSDRSTYICRQRGLQAALSQ